MNDIDNLDSAQLTALLKEELDKPTPNRDVVVRFLGELERRDPVKEIPIEMVFAWEKFREDDGKRKSHLWTHLRRIAISAVLTVVLLGIVPSALGMENFFELVGKWTSGIFSFGKTDAETFTFRTDHSGLQEIYDAVNKLGLTQNVVPTWLPEGFEIEQFSKKEAPSGNVICAVFTDGESCVAIKVSTFEETCAMNYQKDAEDVQVYEKNGITHYIFSNIGEVKAVWTIGNAECYIATDDAVDIHKIISSIYCLEE